MPPQSSPVGVTWRSIASGHPSSAWPELARDAILSGRLDPASAAVALGDAYCVSSNDPLPLLLLPTETWVRMFREGLGGVFLHNTRLHECARPTSPLTLYRAATVPYARGMSWSPFREVAARIVRRRGRGVLWQAQIEPDAMLAGFAGYTEIVVDPELLGDVVRLREKVSADLVAVDRLALHSSLASCRCDAQPARET